MKTNREKYIDSMTDKRLALFLSHGSQIIDNQIDINPLLTDDEEIRKQVARNCDEIEKWLSRGPVLSADEMFAELGYKCSTYKYFGIDKIHYTKEIRDDMYDSIVIDIHKDGIYYIKRTQEGFGFGNDKRLCYGSTISSAEDKAIHKKIEEIKSKVGYK